MPLHWSDFFVHRDCCNMWSNTRCDSFEYVWNWCIVSNEGYSGTCQIAINLVLVAPKSSSRFFSYVRPTFRPNCERTYRRHICEYPSISRTYECTIVSTVGRTLRSTAVDLPEFASRPLYGQNFLYAFVPSFLLRKHSIGIAQLWVFDPVTSHSNMLFRVPSCSLECVVSSRSSYDTAKCKLVHKFCFCCIFIDNIAISSPFSSVVERSTCINSHAEVIRSIRVGGIIFDRFLIVLCP